MMMRKRKQTDNKPDRLSDGQFAPGNALGNRFQSGESGNPKGRPRRTALSDALRARLAEKMPDKDERTIAEAIAEKLCDEALNGNVQAAREIADRVEGKPKQHISASADLSMFDWLGLARQFGLSEKQVLEEARRLLEGVGDE
jgi:hypothetical protein